MQHKYCIKFSLEGQPRSGYFKGHNPNQALIRCLTHYKYKAINYLEIEGDPLPVAKDFAAKQIIKKLTAKQIALKKKQGALKFQRLHGKLPY